MNARAVRVTAVGVVAVDAAAVLTAVLVAVHRPDQAAATTPDRGVVVQSRCIDGRITQGIDDGSPAGLLAYDTGVSC